MSENSPITSTWTRKQEELCVRWHKQAIEYAWKHDAVAKSYYFWHRAIGIPTVATLGITGTGFFAVMDDRGQCGENKIIQICVGIVIIFTAIVSGIHIFLNLGQLSEKHTSMTMRLRNYANSLEAELAFPRNVRINGKIFVKQAQKRLGELTDTNLNIPSRFDKKYKKKLKNNEIEELLEVIIDDTFAKDEIEEDGGELQNEIDEELGKINIKHKIDHVRQSRVQVQDLNNYFM